MLKRFHTHYQWGTPGRGWTQVVADQAAALATVCAAIEDAVNTDWLAPAPGAPNADEKIYVTLTVEEARQILSAQHE